MPQLKQITILWQDSEIGYGEAESSYDAMQAAIDSVDPVYHTVRHQWTYSEPCGPAQPFDADAFYDREDVGCEERPYRTPADDADEFYERHESTPEEDADGYRAGDIGDAATLRGDYDHDDVN